MKNNFVVLIFFIFLLSCSSEPQKKSESFTSFYTGEEINIFSSKNLNRINQVFMADSRLLNHMDSLFVVVNGQFIIDNTEHEPSFEIFSYSSSDSLDGSFIRFSLNQENLKTLNVELFTRDNVSVALCTVQHAVAFNGVFKVAVQFDNFISGGRVTLWNLFISPETRKNLNFDLLNLNTASCTTQKSTSISRLGFGHRWGLLTNYVKIHDVKRESPYEL